MSTLPRYAVNDEDLESLSGEWESLLSDRDNVFLHPAWLRLWRHVFPDERSLRILAVREGSGELIGVGAFLIGDKALTLAGDPEIWDYAGIATRAGCEAEVLHALLGHLAPDVPELQLWGIEEGSPLVDALPQVAAAHGIIVEREQEAVCPTIDLPESWDAYLASLSKKDRHELRRKMRRFDEAEGDVRVVALREPDAVLAALPDFIRLHVESRPDKAEFMTEQMQHFFRHIAEEFARRQQLVLYFLERGAERIASLLCFEAGDSLMLYNSGYDPAYAHVSVGIVSKALCLKQAIEDGKRSFNFLRGEERYKYDLGAHDTLVYHYRLRRD